MKHFTVPQAVMYCNRAGKNDLEYTEMQGAIVCSMFAGKYKRATTEVDDLKSIGVLEDTV